MTVLTNARLVQGDQVVDGGWIRCEGERFAEVGRGHPPSVVVRDGRAELVDGSSLAGSTLTMDAAFRRAVRDQDLPVVAAARAAATTPATLLGLDDVGLIAPAPLANPVVLRQDLTVHAVLYRGSWVDGRTP